MMKRFLVPVLALVACGLPAGASVAVYCDSGCGANTTAAFDSLIILAPYTYAYGADQTFTSSLVSSIEYLDSTGVDFMDTASGNTFAITGANGLATSGTNGTILISVPTAYAALQLSISSSLTNGGFTCLDSGCDGTQVSTTPIIVDYLNSTPGSPWTVQISTSSPESIILDAFNPAGADSGPGPGNADAPEVGTLLLIGTGLIGMRWMKRVPARFFRTAQTA